MQTFSNLCNASSEYEEVTSSFTMSLTASSSFSSLESLVATTLTSESFLCQNNSNNPVDAVVDQENINQELIIYLILAVSLLISFGLNFCLISFLIWKKGNREKLVLSEFRNNYILIYI